MNAQGVTWEERIDKAHNVLPITVKFENLDGPLSYVEIVIKVVAPGCSASRFTGHALLIGLKLHRVLLCMQIYTNRTHI